MVLLTYGSRTRNKKKQFELPRPPPLAQMEGQHHLPCAQGQGPPVLPIPGSSMRGDLRHALQLAQGAPGLERLQVRFTWIAKAVAVDGPFDVPLSARTLCH